MKTWAKILLTVLVIGLVIAGFFGGYYFKVYEYSREFNVNGKTFIYNQTEIVWNSDYTDEQKENVFAQLGEGMSEESLKQRYDDYYKDNLTISFKDGQATVTLSPTTSNDDLTYTQSFDGESVTIYSTYNGEKSVFFALKYINGNLCVNLMASIQSPNLLGEYMDIYFVLSLK